MVRHANGGLNNSLVQTMVTRISSVRAAGAKEDFETSSEGVTHPPPPPPAVAWLVGHGDTLYQFGAMEREKLSSIITIPP